ncbi:MAG: Adaptor for signal transduction [Tremellales sp. Tagirdzhanova-0007]|nr:MAG: Adaptor for signal transduction [Tremellales sp. Tagirdzhanova-0007]
MAVTSPTSASPGLSLLEWDEAAVQSWMIHISLGQYEDLIYDQGITGDVLSAMDHISLQDLGMTSVGHRLNLLRAVWELKRTQGIIIGDDDWRPQDAVSEGMSQVQPSSIDRLWDLILEQHERLVQLERSVSGLLNTLEENGIAVPLPTTAERGVMSGNAGSEQQDGRVDGGQWKNSNGRSSNVEDGELGLSKTRKRPSQLYPSSLTSSLDSTAPGSSESSTVQGSYTPTAASGASYLLDSPIGRANKNSDKAHPAVAKPINIQPPPFTRLLSGSSNSSASGAVSTPPSGALSLGLASAKSSSQSMPPSSSSMLSVNPAPTTTHTSAVSSTSHSPSERDRSRAKDAAHSAAKSFRVTLEDPCWRVLPAALKKYKINDDWKLYALFICYGNTERCLSYDEKPLMLFQRLKESGQRPVFMLRHIRDIRSPIAVAQQKQAVKLGLPANTTTNVLPKIKLSTDTSISPTKANGNTLFPARSSDDSQTPNGGTFPELPSPGLREGDGSRSAGVAGTLIDREGKVTNVTYAVAIYPYIADRQDEFDVAVGATFLILSKTTKGWYIVQKDPVGLGNIVPDQSKSGWVPAGCLLEISSPIAAITPCSGEFPGLSPLPATAIMSSSYLGVVLMDYEAKASDELTLKEGEKVKVYKKYCHWSYTIKQDSGDRGWVPGWFIGKLGGSGTDSQPASATTLTGSATLAVGDSMGARDGEEENAAAGS